jgi:hypothetical protein
MIPAYMFPMRRATSPFLHTPLGTATASSALSCTLNITLSTTRTVVVSGGWDVFGDSPTQFLVDGSVMFPSNGPGLYSVQLVLLNLPAGSHTIEMDMNTAANLALCATATAAVTGTDGAAAFYSNGSGNVASNVGFATAFPSETVCMTLVVGDGSYSGGAGTWSDGGSSPDLITWVPGQFVQIGNTVLQEGFGFAPNTGDTFIAQCTLPVSVGEWDLLYIPVY